MSKKPAKPSFSKSAKIRLIERDMTLEDLAQKVGAHKWSVSIVINQLRHYPKLEAKIRKELNLEEPVV